MAQIGYARVSTTDQSLDIQVQQLIDAGCARIFSEKKSGTNLERPQFDACLRYLRDDDTLMVTRLDRLARSTTDLFKIIDVLKSKGVQFKVLLQPEIDTTTPNGRLVLGILAVIAEFETAIRKERQREGIERARAEGVYEIVREKALAREARRRKMRENRVEGQRKRFSPVAPPQPTLPSAAAAVEPEPTPETQPRKPAFFGRFGRP